VVALPESVLVVVLAAAATGAAAMAAATAPAANSGAKLRSLTVIVLLPNRLGGSGPLQDFLAISKLGKNSAYVACFKSNSNPRGH
jgi:hypothetical protein